VQRDAMQPRWSSGTSGACGGSGETDFTCTGVWLHLFPVAPASHPCCKPSMQGSIPYEQSSAGWCSVPRGVNCPSAVTPTEINPAMDFAFITLSVVFQPFVWLPVHFGL